MWAECKKALADIFRCMLKRPCNILLNYHSMTLILDSASWISCCKHFSVRSTISRVISWNTHFLSLFFFALGAVEDNKGWWQRGTYGPEFSFCIAARVMALSLLFFLLWSCWPLLFVQIGTAPTLESTPWCLHVLVRYLHDTARGLHDLTLVHRSWNQPIPFMPTCSCLLRSLPKVEQQMFGHLSHGTAYCLLCAVQQYLACVFTRVLTTDRLRFLTMFRKCCRAPLGYSRWQKLSSSPLLWCLIVCTLLWIGKLQIEFQFDFVVSLSLQQAYVSCLHLEKKCIWFVPFWEQGQLARALSLACKLIACKQLQSFAVT